MKCIYIWSIAIVVLLSIVSLWVSICYDLPIEYVAWIPSTVALVISVISLSVADPKQKELQLDINVWVAGKSTIGLFLKLVFQVINKSDKALYLPRFNFRSPKSILSIDKSRKDQKYHVYEFGQTVMAINDQIHFLGTNQGDNSVQFEHHVDLTDWEKGKFYFSIHSDGYKVKTVIMTKDQIDEIVSSTSEKPLLLHE